MNYLETTVASWCMYLMFISVILIIIVAGTISKGEKAYFFIRIFSFFIQFNIPRDKSTIFFCGREKNRTC